MGPGKLNFIIKQGAFFEYVLTLEDENGAVINLTGYTSPKLQIRDTDDDTLIADLTSTPNANGDKLTLGGTAGTVAIYISALSTAAMNFDEGKYDLFITDSLGKPDCYVEGVVSFDRRTTL